MIRLGLAREAYWIDLPHGVRVQVRPLTTAIYEAARAKAHRLARDLSEGVAEACAVGATVEGLPDLSDPDALAGLSQMLFTQALAQAGIVAWEGVGGPEGDAVLPVTTANVAELMLVPKMAESFVVQYTRAHLDMVAEGNGSAPAPNGTTAAGAAIATGVPHKASPAHRESRAKTASAARTSSTSR